MGQTASGVQPGHAALHDPVLQRQGAAQSSDSVSERHLPRRFKARCSVVCMDASSSINSSLGLAGRGSTSALSPRPADSRLTAAGRMIERL